MMFMLPKNPITMLLIIQALFSASYGIIYASGYILFKNSFLVSINESFGIIGVFIAVSGMIRFFATRIGERLLDYKSIFVLCLMVQAFAFYIMFTKVFLVALIGLTLFTTAYAFIVAAFNMLIENELATHKNAVIDGISAYSKSSISLNIGMFFGALVGFLGFEYNASILIGALFNYVGLLLAMLSWKRIKVTQLDSLKKNRYVSFLAIFILFAVCVYIAFLFYLIVYIAMVLMTVYIIDKLRKTYLQLSSEHKKLASAFFQYLFYTTFFWLCYFLVPMIITHFAHLKSKVAILGVDIVLPAQWIATVNTLIMVFFTFLVPLLFIRKKVSNYNFFAASIFLMLCGFVALFISVAFTAHTGFFYVALVLFFVIGFSFGEIAINPCGFNMISTILPKNLRSLFMGSWLFFTGSLSAVMASVLSQVFTPLESGYKNNNEALSNIYFTWCFGIVSLSLAVILICFLTLSKKRCSILQ
ncbi:hypothetical protein [Cysteiniphilum marinum]|uniref:hypothetical protein n=1 Tax=Cysteiniphilum marinum TaxID=2774191 RepID=UPI001F484CE0|nr:hypothetical protein [Cysteiniphilum marinum]